MYWIKCNHNLLRNNLKNYIFLYKNQSSMNYPNNYQKAIETLNNLQSNAEYLKNAASSLHYCPEELDKIRKYFIRVGLDQKKLGKLSIIHVSGTKGKGSVCAFCELILRDKGFKTGFYSSPHLIEVRERIKINGKSIEPEKFSKYFWKIYKLLNEKKNDETDMPLYFRYLTIMAFDIFIEENVDVAIIEVGIGGEYDCTNILDNVPVVGITSLGYDHMFLLGNTIESIAWNKAGIMKTNCQAFTVKQSEKAFKVLQERSIEKKCSLKVVNNHPLIQELFQTATWPTDIYKTNLSLALSLCEAWMSTCRNKTLKLDLKRLNKILKNFSWPGRYQIIKHKNIEFYLDGAHTVESIKICLNWFINNKNNFFNNTKKVLIFNVIGFRDATSLLNELINGNFDIIIFVPNICKKMNNDNADLTISEQLERCRNYKEIWLNLFKNKEKKGHEQIVKSFSFLDEAINYLEDNENFYQVLVTGSLHLVGNLLSLLNNK